MKIVYAGTPEFAVPGLQALAQAGHAVVAVYTQPDRPAGRGRKLRPSPVKEAAQGLGIEVRQPASLRTADAQAALRALGPDLMVVAAYGLILPPAVLETPRLGCVNIHASLLPRWRGAAPIQRALLAGDRETGVTIMQMDAGLDTGAMLAHRTTPITPEDTAGTVHDRLAALGAQALLDVLPGLAAGALPGVPQDAAQATYARKLTKDEAMIDWTQPAAQIARQVQAFNPWPVAETRWRGAPLKVLEARALPGAVEASPGTPSQATREGIDIATGEGVLRVLRLQLAGRKAQTAAEFINGRDIGQEPLPN
ncbi:methionyl-tRNA formyltransferase [Acidihalobacter ferrooxydans]|uniref:Methionyl-tRNA formyltransferase n=1 Tax=Acidihalobacter ferrooxydans TaxID=1765967 RepID=A0A1P8UKK4_9GAMM|nr:methionyl-tRNA formyltransferase [Acidihalobacter ferrooxydans]APZ44376.1 methionyl-tRNA formyltransferase [Acidihalobacter ferrooxydans]